VVAVCRLFGLSGGPERVSATFWLLNAPDSLSDQSRREPDGTGIGAYDACGRPVVDKQPLAAYADHEFAREARKIISRTFVAHVRYASTGDLTLRNTHPFQLDDRLFAHNGVLEDLPALERELGGDLARVQGDTDSERFLALITREIERCGDVGAGIAVATRWVAEHLPLLSANFVLIDASDLWALRYPDTHDLYVLERLPGGHRGNEPLEHSGQQRPDRMRVTSGTLADRPSVVVATERMDDDPGWRPLTSGELLHVDANLTVSSDRIIARAPARPLSLADLGQQAAASQRG
jgi:predicted glutamine amidotransferase